MGKKRYQVDVDEQHVHHYIKLIGSGTFWAGVAVGVMGCVIAQIVLRVWSWIW
jgi:hypothetical protein